MKFFDSGKTLIGLCYACAVEAAPAVRHPPGRGLIGFDEIIDALRELDRQAEKFRVPHYRRVLAERRPEFLDAKRDGWPAKTPIVGSWTLSIADHVRADGTKILASARFRAAPPHSALTAAIPCRSRPWRLAHGLRVRRADLSCVRRPATGTVERSGHRAVARQAGPKCVHNPIVRSLLADGGHSGASRRRRVRPTQLHEP